MRRRRTVARTRGITWASISKDVASPASSLPREINVVAPKPERKKSLDLLVFGESPIQETPLSASLARQTAVLSTSSLDRSGPFHQFHGNTEPGSLDPFLQQRHTFVAAHPIVVPPPQALPHSKHHERASSCPPNDSKKVVQSVDDLLSRDLDFLGIH